MLLVTDDDLRCRVGNPTESFVIIVVSRRQLFTHHAGINLLFYVRLIIWVYCLRLGSPLVDIAHFTNLFTYLYTY